MRHKFLVPALVLLGLDAGSIAVRADGGTLRLVAQAGTYRITVFTTPTPLRAGPVDISVLVQDAATAEPLPEAVVRVTLTRPGEDPIRGRATREAATNKLFRAVNLELPTAGEWQAEVAVDDAHGEARARFVLEAAERLPRWAELWPWFAWPVVPVALFALRELRGATADGRVRGF